MFSKNNNDRPVAEREYFDRPVVAVVEVGVVDCEDVTLDVTEVV